MAAGPAGLSTPLSKALPPSRSAPETLRCSGWSPSSSTPGTFFPPGSVRLDPREQAEWQDNSGGAAAAAAAAHMEKAKSIAMNSSTVARRVDHRSALR